MITFESRLTDYLEHAGVRGLTSDLVVHKARMDEITWTKGLIELHLGKLQRDGVLLYHKGYYRLAKYAQVEEFI